MTNYTIYICNAFSINMLPGGTMVNFVPMDVDDVKQYIREERADNANVVSAIGHEDMARIVSKQLGIDIPMNRTSVKLSVEVGITDIAVVAQYSGQRLPEGATMLPEGAEIRYWLVIPGMEYATEPI